MRKYMLLPALAVAGGGAGFALRYWQLSSALDQDTLLFRSGAPATLALVGLLAVLAVAMVLLARGGAAAGEYRQAFYCPSSGYMTLMVAGSFLMLAAAALGFLEAREQVALWRMEIGYPFPGMLLLTAAMCLPGAVAGLLLGRGNYHDTLPACYPLLTTLPAYAVLPWIVAFYQANSRQPEVMLFAPALLGVVCAGLGFYGAATFAFERPRPKLCVVSSLMAVALLLTALADRPSRFFAVMSLSCVLMLLGQSFALLHSMFAPPWPPQVHEEDPEAPELKENQG